GRASGQPRPMSGKTTLFPRNDGGGQIENLHFPSRNTIGSGAASGKFRPRGKTPRKPPIRQASLSLAHPALDTL
ncbi:hypothetical protein, partial [uncultured Desulfovibrio sp.]|uniref:hypothetical protein n=1 Tax=uncultured Desulfovibrio sp. TaxID=167968 RepID=UPI00272AF292